MNLLEVGKIINTHGLKGEVKIVTWTDSPDVFEDLEYVIIKSKKGDITLTIKGVKYQKNNIIVKFRELERIEDAEPLKNSVLYAPREMLGELPDGVYYIADLIGLEVFDDEGQKIGIIADVFSTGANDVYDIKREGQKNLLLPVIDDVVLDVDIEGGKVTVHIMEGLLDL